MSAIYALQSGHTSIFSWGLFWLIDIDDISFSRILHLKVDSFSLASLSLLLFCVEWTEDFFLSHNGMQPRIWQHSRQSMLFVTTHISILSLFADILPEKMGTSVYLQTYAHATISYVSWSRTAEWQVLAFWFIIISPMVNEWLSAFQDLGCSPRFSCKFSLLVYMAHTADDDVIDAIHAFDYA